MKRNSKKKKDIMISIQAWIGIIMYFVGLYTFVNRLANVVFRFSAWVAEKVTQKRTTKTTEDEEKEVI